MRPTLATELTNGSDTQQQGADRWGDLLPLVGTAIEVRDTHGIWSTARVIMPVIDRVHGPLLLVHFEGWSASWLMWFSPVDERDRFRVLSLCPGIGSRGNVDQGFFDEMLRLSLNRIQSGFRWPQTSGHERTKPFLTTNTYVPSFQGGEVAFDTWYRMLRRVPIQDCSDLAESRTECESMLATCASTSWHTWLHRPPGDTASSSAGPDADHGPTSLLDRFVTIMRQAGTRNHGTWTEESEDRPVEL